MVVVSRCVFKLFRISWRVRVPKGLLQNAYSPFAKTSFSSLSNRMAAAQSSTVTDVNLNLFSIEENRNKEDLLFIRNHPAYRELVYHYDAQSIAACVQHPVLKDFIALSTASPDAVIMDPKYQLPLESLLKCLSELTEEELQHALFHLHFFPRPSKEQKKEFVRIWTAFDDECIKRGVERKRWRAAINFVYSDLWGLLLLNRFSSFHWIFIKICMRKLDSLPREKFVRLCQTICKTKRLPDEVKLFNVEYNIPRVIIPSEENNFREITMPELSLICLVYYKMKSPIHNRELVCDILTMCTKNSKTISSPSLSGVCKGLALSIRLDVHEYVGKLLTAMIPEVHRLDASACASLLLLAKQNSVQNLKLMSEVADRVKVLCKEDVKSFGVREFVWLAEAFECLDYQSSSIFETLYEAMQDQGRLSNRYQAKVTDGISEVATNSENSSKDLVEDTICYTFQQKLVPVLNSLTYGGVYPVNLISKALSPEFLLRHYGKSMYTYSPDIIKLDLIVTDEIKDYSGPRLTDKVRGFLTKKHMKWVRPVDAEKMPAYNMYGKNVYLTAIKALDNPSCAYLCNVVPQFGSIELVLCTTNSGEPVEVPELFKSKPEFQPKYLTPDDLASGVQYHAILLHFRNELLWPSDEPTGARRRFKLLAEKMGFITYDLSFNVWKTLKTAEEMESYLLTVLSNGNIKIPGKHRSQMQGSN